MMKDTLKAVLAPFGPSGSETPIYEALAGMIEGHVDETRTDALGNLIAVKRGKEGGKRIMLSAHMDTIGLIVVDADKDGYLRVSNLGGINAGIYTGRHVRFGNGAVGVTHREPVKAGESATLSKVFVDVGASSREEALEKVPVGTTASVVIDVTDLGDRVAAPYMDDRAACAVVVELLRALDGCKNEIVAVFSTQEEVGCRGAKVAAYSVKPDIGIAVDVTLTGDTPGCDPMAVKLGAGPTVKVKDSGSISTPMVRDGLAQAAKEIGQAFQYEVLSFGGTDAMAIMVSEGGIPACTVSIPCRYVHSPVEMVSIADMEGAVRLLKAYVDQV